MAKIEPGMEAMLDVYFFETNSLLEQLDEILLRTEQANEFENEDIKEIFRIMHTIKGSSAMMGFENLSTLAHKAEDMFFVIRENPDVITDVSFVYDLVFQVSDSYKAQIEALQNNVGGERAVLLPRKPRPLKAPLLPKVLLPRRLHPRRPLLRQRRVLRRCAFSSRTAVRWKTCARSCL